MDTGLTFPDYEAGANWGRMKTSYALNGLGNFYGGCVVKDSVKKSQVALKAHTRTRNRHR